MAKHNPGLPPGADADYHPLDYSFVSLEGFLNARLLTEVIDRAVVTLRRELCRQRVGVHCRKRLPASRLEQIACRHLRSLETRHRFAEVFTDAREHIGILVSGGNTVAVNFDN